MKLVILLAVFCAMACTVQAQRWRDQDTIGSQIPIGYPSTGPTYDPPPMHLRFRRAGKGGRPPASVLSAEAKTNLHNREFHPSLEFEYQQSIINNERTKLDAFARATLQNGRVDPQVGVTFEHKFDKK